jgi:effector-binding domain-containing protein
MKILKYVLISIAALIALLVIVGFLMPREVHVERSKVVAADQSVVYTVLLSPEQFQEWSPWSYRDTNMKVDYFGPVSGVGAGFKWDGNSDVGYGTWTITNTKPLSEISIELQWQDSDPSQVMYRLEPTDKGTKVTWVMHSDYGNNPFGRLMGVVMKGMIADDYDEGLQRLDDYLSAMPKGRVDKIEEQMAPSFAYLSMRKQIKPNAVGEMLAKSYGAIMEHINANKMQVAAFPFAFYHHWPMDGDTGPADVEAAIPVAKSGAGTSDIISATFQSGPIVIAYFYGPYDQVSIAHRALHEWAATNGKKLGDVPWEVYVTDPQEQPDPTKILTMVCYRVLAS